MKKLYLNLFLTFILCCNVRALDVWYRLPVSGDAELWFLGFEENEFIRNQIGDWLPMRLFKSDGSELLWRFEELKRIDNRASFILRVRSKGGREYEVGTSPFMDKGPDGQPEAVVSQEGSDLFISLTMGDGSVRRILFRRGRDVDDLRARTKISRASALWDWNIEPISLCLLPPDDSASNGRHN